MIEERVVKDESIEIIQSEEHRIIFFKLTLGQYQAVNTCMIRDPEGQERMGEKKDLNK